MRSTHVSEYDLDNQHVEVNERVTDSGEHYIQVALCDRSEQHGDIVREHWVSLVMDPDVAINLSKCLKIMGKDARRHNQ